jgi:cytochrome P450
VQTREVLVQTQPPPANALAAVTHPDPYPYYADLRAYAEPFRDEEHGLWIAASAAAVAGALAHQDLTVRPAAERVPRALAGGPAGEIFGRLVRMTDGDGHCPWKRAVASTLDGADVGQLAEAARRWSRALLTETLSESAGNRVDRLALTVPCLALAEALGAEPDACPAVAAAAAALARSFAPGASTIEVARGHAAAASLLDSFTAAVRDGSALGLLGTFAAAAASNGRGDEIRATLVANAIGFLTQAHEATAGLIGNTLLALAREEEAAARLAATANRLDRAALEPFVTEVARFDPPVHNTRRFVPRETILTGERLAAGDVVLVLLAAANRDPAANSDPDRFDTNRRAPRSFTFGAGAHACPGAPLAVALAAEIVAQVLAAGIAPGALLPGFVYRPSLNTRVPLFGGLEGT